jgi:hypothetical protein
MRYTINPAEQSFQAWDAERKRKRWDYWSAVRSMRAKYLEENKGDLSMNRPSLHFWAEGKYGFRMEADGSGNYTENYTVTDPKKFMLFQIKYWR